jgi:TetR/AcrR family transcriptional regulator, ethionamide resistance regulator
MARDPSRRDQPGLDNREVRQSILDATERLLADRRFDELPVSDILAAASVSRGSFYFYFEGKHAVLAELVRQAVSEGRAAARPWLAHAGDQHPGPAIREGTIAGAALWKDKAGILRAIVENWRSDEELAQLWTGLMRTFTDAAVDRVEQDRRDGIAPTTHADLAAVASALTWLNERVFYLAAIGVAPFDDERCVVDVLTEIWTASFYGQPSTSPPPPTIGAGSKKRRRHR